MLCLTYCHQLTGLSVLLLDLLNGLFLSFLEVVLQSDGRLNAFKGVPELHCLVRGPKGDSEVVEVDFVVLGYVVVECQIEPRVVLDRKSVV